MSRAIGAGILSLCFLTIPSTVSASSWHVGYDIGQMAVNDFKYIAGEVGYRFENNHALRLAVFNVALSERHLSSGEASVVKGDNVEGLWRGMDLYYDYPVTNNIFISPSIGYHEETYTHTVLGTSVGYSSPSAGFALSYLDIDNFGLKNLYWKFSLNFQYIFQEQEDEMLGDSIVNRDSFSFTPAMFIGYVFD